MYQIKENVLNNISFYFFPKTNGNGLGLGLKALTLPKGEKNK